MGSGGREIDKIDMDGSNKVRICTGYCSNDVRTGTITSDGTYIYALSQHATYLLGYTIFRISPDRGGEALSDSDVWHTYNTPLLRDGEERGMSCVPFKGIYYQRGIYYQQNWGPQKPWSLRKIDTTTKEETTVPNGPLYGVEGTNAKYQGAGHMDTADNKLYY